MNLSRLCFALLMTYSFSAMSEVSIQEKENRVDFIEKIGNVAPSLSVDAYKRELNYEKMGMPLDQRAKNEALIIAEQIQNQISIAYDKSMKEHGDSDRAIADIKQAIDKDLELAAPEFKKELLALSLKTLNDLKSGGLSNSVQGLSNLEKSILPNVEERSRYLNEEVVDAFMPKDMFKYKDEERLEYKNKEEILSSLVSVRDNVFGSIAANMEVATSEITTIEANLSLQVKFEFLGVSLEAGPTIIFKREYTTNVKIVGDGLGPILLPDGTFDTNKKDRTGRAILVDGKVQRRLLTFGCEAVLKFSTDYKGAGGFKFLGLGGGASATQTYANLVTMNSRRILVPDYVGGLTYGISDLAKLCHKDFLNTKLNDTMTVQDSLNVMMKNVVAGLRFSHPRTKCAVMTDCIDWFNNEVVYLWKLNTYPRCVEEQREKFRSCAVLGLEGSACRVYKNGKMISSGSWEIDCDKGLSCVQTREANWHQYARGKCKINDARTYRNPIQYPEYRTADDYISVELR